MESERRGDLPQLIWGLIVITGVYLIAGLTLAIPGATIVLGLILIGVSWRADRRLWRGVGMAAGAVLAALGVLVLFA